MKTLTRIHRQGWFRSFFRILPTPLVPLVCGLLLCGSGTKADTIYDNSTNDQLVRLDPGTLEVGDEIVLAGTARYLTNFSFEYWGTSLTPGQFAGNVEVCIRFYMNNGIAVSGYPSPGTKFYESGWFAIQPSERTVLEYVTPADLPPQGLLIPATEMTWSAQFRGLGFGDAAGVDLYGPVSAGLGYPDYWVNTLTGWQLETNSTSAINFAAQFKASQTPVVTRPTLAISSLPGKTVVSWPDWAFNYDLQLSSAVVGSPWTVISSGIYLTDGNYYFTNDVIPGAKAFFRLRKVQ